MIYSCTLITLALGAAGAMAQQQQQRCTDVTVAGGGVAQYTCLGNLALTECLNHKPAGTPQLCETFADFGGSSVNSQCYDGVSVAANVCGPPQPPCVAAGVFPAQGVHRCSHFYTCLQVVSPQNYIQVVGGCPSGLEFNPTTRVCEAGGCSAASPSPPPQQQVCFPLSRQTDPTSCGHFFQCSLLGTARARVQCPRDMLFDSIFRVCKLFTLTCGSRPRP